MAVMRPESVVFTYADGSSVEAAFSALPAPLREELLRQPELACRAGDPSGDRFLVLEWEDGWEEVLRVDGGCTGVKRYYVISRNEDVGRLALEHESGYPELVEIDRRPLGLRRVTFQGTFSLTPGSAKREGGKTDTDFSLEPAPDRLPELAARLAEAGDDPAASGLVAGRCARDLEDFAATIAGTVGS